MQVDRWYPLIHKLLRQLLGAMLGAGEQDGAPTGGRQVGEHRTSVRAVESQHVVVHGGNR